MGSSFTLVMRVDLQRRGPNHYESAESGNCDRTRRGNNGVRIHADAVGDGPTNKPYPLTTETNVPPREKLV